MNNSKLKLINNGRYVISKINLSEKEIIVKNDRNEFIINKDDFQKTISCWLRFHDTFVSGHDN